MVNSQLSHIAKVAIGRSSLAPALRKMFRRSPLTPAIVRARSFGWVQASQWLMSPPGQTLLADPELHQTLRNHVNEDIPTELLLIASRRLLLNAQADFFVIGGVYKLLASLVYQAALNDFVWRVTPQELTRIAELQSTLSALKPGEHFHWTAFAQLAMYFPPDKILGENVLRRNYIPAMADAPEWLETFFSDYLKAKSEEEEIRRSLGGNEPSPASHWRLPDLHFPPHRRHHLAEFFNQTELDFMEQPFRVLLVGCDLASRALEYAMSYGGQASVLVVDTDVSKLVYATRCVRKLGVTNIRFQRLDVDALAKLPETFDVLECVGVLNHLTDPVAGAAAMISRVSPGGIAHFSLFSELAQQQITQLRGDHLLIEAKSDEEIREARYRLMKREQQTIDEHLQPHQGFFNLVTCRDLLFHPRVNCFTLPQIGELLQALNLEFRGLDKPDLVRSRLWTHYPPAKKLCDLNAWQKFELDHPDAFTGQYQVWCKKPV